MTYNRIFAALAAALLITTSSAYAQDIKEGAQAPDFTLTLSTGKQVKLSDYKGKAVLLHFWATWCPPCRKELPEMNKLAEELSASKNRLTFLGVCVSDDEKSRSAFMTKNNYTFTGGLDKDGSIAGKYSVEGIPTSILISPEGKIEKINVGAMSSSGIASFVKAYK